MSLGKVSVAIEAQMAGFESDMGRAARIAEKELKKIERDAKRTESELKAFGNAAGLAIAAGVTAAATAIKSTINAMDDMSKAAQKVGLTTEEFSKLTYAAGLADVSMETLVGSLGKLTKAQAAALKENSQQAKVFEALGIAVSNADGSLRESSDVLADFADRFRELEGSPEAMAAGFAIFGRSFQEMVPLIKDGGGAIREAGEEAEAFGAVLSTQAGKDAEAFNDNLTRLTTAAQGLAIQVAGPLLEAMVPLTDEFADAASEGDKLATTADSISSAILQIAGAAKQAINFIGGVREVLNGLQDQAVAYGDLFLKFGGDEALGRIRASGDRIAGAFSNPVIGGGASTGPVGNAPPDLLGITRGLPGSTFSAVPAFPAGTSSVRADALRTALGGSGGGGGGKGKRSAAVKERREEVTEMMAIEEAWAEAEVDASNRKADAWLKEQDALADRQERYESFMADLQMESELLGKTAEDQRVMTALRYADAFATDEQKKAIEEQVRMAERAAEVVSDQIEAMDGLRDASREFLSDLKAGEGVWDSLKKAADNFADTLFRIIANNLIEKAFGQQGTNSGGSFGGIFASVLGSLFGGGRAMGGPVSANRFYEVGEGNRPELLSVAGKTFLIPGNDGRVTPIRSTNGGGVVQQFYTMGTERRETTEQKARLAGREARRALARTGA